MQQIREYQAEIKYLKQNKDKAAQVGHMFHLLAIDLYGHFAKTEHC
jgi:hypothetical protein